MMHMQDDLYCYAINCVTHGEDFELAFRRADIDGVMERHYGDTYQDVRRSRMVEVEQLVFSSKAGFLELGWNGRDGDGPMFFTLPFCGTLLLGCVIKPGDKTPMYVASQMPLPWLE